MVEHSNSQPGALNDRQAAPSEAIDLPIDMAQRLVLSIRRVRWLLMAIALVLCVLLASARISLPEAAFTFTFLALTAFLSGAPTARTNLAARSVQQAKAFSSGGLLGDLQKIIKVWPQPVILIDERASIRSINAAASDLLDSPKMGDPLAFRLRDPDVLRVIQRALSEGVGETCTLIEKVPAERMLVLHVRPFDDNPFLAGQTGGPRTGKHDATGNRHALIVIEDETNTYRNERMRSDFVANASHELRTPLASITGCIETMQGPARHDPVGQQRFMTIMSQQAARMTALIDDLLSLNRIEMQAHRRPADCVDLEGRVREAMDLTRPGADAAGVSVELVVSASPATVRGDAGELRQVAANLLQNAVKYGASGKRITISLRDALEGGVRMIEMEVRDYGPGIAPVHLPRLTERFYRAYEGSDPLASGTGLGLAIVKHIVARHRGRLLIDSRPGEGASFAIRIPFLAKPEVLPVPLDKTMEDQLRKLSHD